MQHLARHNVKPAPFRWGVVVRVVLATCAVALIAIATWYAAAFALPAWRRARQDRAMESAEIQLLAERVSQIERFIKLSANP
ncbi:MAG: hypothetical protein ABSH56_00020 [Bryobacteraceae bacterium]|jgi:hypothetical protein